jgi:acetyl esterase/lipase
MSAFHPDLARARFIPKFTISPRLARRMQRSAVPAPPVHDDLAIEDVLVDGPAGPASVRVRLYRPKQATGATPALLWIHGGGFILGSPEQDERASIAFARELGITMAATTYRLAPDHVSPAAVEDAYAALTWLVAHAAERGIDPDRIAIGGASAGGGIAAALALYAHDRGEVTPAFQLLVYPMIDDRTVLRDGQEKNARMWSERANRLAWTAYLGTAPGSEGVSPYAAPARRDDLAGLPPAWIGVGSLDLFHDEDLAYAERLRAAGIEVETLVVPGAFHGFDAVMHKAAVSREFLRHQLEALRKALLR